MRTGTNHSKESREFENKEQTARKRQENWKQGANCSKGAKDFENKEQTARKRIEDLKTRSKLFERD